jgi:hypothetical protein
MPLLRTPSVRVCDLPEAGAPADPELLENRPARKYSAQTELYLSFRRTHGTYPTQLLFAGVVEKSDIELSGFP